MPVVVSVPLVDIFEKGGLVVVLFQDPIFDDFASSKELGEDEGAWVALKGSKSIRKRSCLEYSIVHVLAKEVWRWFRVILCTIHHPLSGVWGIKLKYIVRVPGTVHLCSCTITVSLTCSIFLFLAQESSKDSLHLRAPGPYMSTSPL